MTPVVTWEWTKTKGAKLTGIANGTAGPRTVAIQWLCSELKAAVAELQRRDAEAELETPTYLNPKQRMELQEKRTALSAEMMDAVYAANWKPRCNECLHRPCICQRATPPAPGLVSLCFCGMPYGHRDACAPEPTPAPAGEQRWCSGQTCLSCGHGCECPCHRRPAPAEAPITEAPAGSAGERPMCAVCSASYHRGDCTPAESAGPIALPVRVETVGNTHRLMDSSGRHWFSFFVENSEGNPSPLPQIADALNASTDEHWESVRDRRRIEAESDAAWAYVNRELAVLRELEDEVRASAEITDYQMSGVTTQRLLEQLDAIRAEREGPRK